MTYEVVRDSQAGSIQVNIHVYNGKTDITKEVGAVYDSTATLDSEKGRIGVYSSEFGSIRVKDGYETRIRYVKYNGRLIPVVRKNN